MWRHLSAVLWISGDILLLTVGVIAQTDQFFGRLKNNWFQTQTAALLKGLLPIALFSLHINLWRGVFFIIY